MHSQTFGEFGIEKVRVKLVDGDQLAFGDEGIKPGRYSIIPLNDAVGLVNFFKKDGSQAGGGKLEKGQEPPSINIDFLDGYEVHFRNMNFKLVPATE